MNIIKAKKEICHALLNLAEKNKNESIRLQKDAQGRANEAEGAMISRYDTFKEEGQYLADALKIRCAEAINAVERIKKVIVSNYVFKESERVEILAFVTIKFEDGAVKKFFIFPAMPGHTINDITVITPSSPIGQSLINKEKGDVFKFFAGGKRKKGEVVEVR